MSEAADIRDWRGRRLANPGGQKIGELEAVYPGTAPTFLRSPASGSACQRGAGYERKQVREAPSIGNDGEQPAGDEEAILTHYGLACQPGARGARLLARL
jgi:hypothetical protein